MADNTTSPDLSKLSNSDLIAISNGDMSKVSNEGIALLSGAPVQKETAFQAFVRGLKNPAPIPGYRGMPGSALAGLAGETIKQVGGATELVAPETGKSIVEVGNAINQGASQANPISTGVGQVGSYILPSMAAYKGLSVGQKALGINPSMLAEVGKGSIGGGALSYLTTPDEENRAKSATISGVVGGVTPLAAKAVEKVVSPTLRPEVEKLIGEGVSLTPGQVLGGRLRALEEKATSFPIIGDVIQKAKDKGVEQFNKAAYKRALDPIGGTVPEVAGRQGVNAVKNQISDAYDALLPKLTFVPDNGLSQNLATLDKTVRGLPKEKADEVANVVTSIIKDRMPPNGLVDGNTFKVIETDLSKLAKKYAGATGTEGLVGDAYAQSLKALRENLARSNPDYAEQLKKVNTAFANYAIIRQAGSMANTAEKFTPSQLANAVKKADQSAGKGATATGKALMQDLTDAGQLVLPSTIPDSGTAGRMMAANLQDWLVGTAATVPYVLGGKAITSRPESAKEIAKLIRQNPDITNALGLGLYRSNQGE